MEVQLVHTTGSPSRHDSDSESSYDKHQQLKSSSEMALHRKQSRRTKKQLSERQRRKRMNSSMEKLGLLVYGKTFQDGLKVDKATLLKDAYEKLQTMKDDYHRGYETAITSTCTFLDHLDGCPKEVKDALTQHLHTTLQGQLCRPCHSTTLDLGPQEDDSNSDSCSPQPMSSSSTLEVPQSRHEEERLHKARHAAPPLSELSPRRPQLPYAAVTPSIKGEVSQSARFGSRQDGGSSSSRPYGLADHKAPDSRTVAEVRASPSCRTVAANAGAGTPCRRQVVETVPPSAGSVYPAAISRNDVIIKSRAASPSEGTPSPSSLPTPSSSSSRFFGGMSHLRPVDPHTPGQERSLRGPYPSPLAYPFYPYPSSSTSTSTPKISPYVTPFAPQDPLYLGCTPPALLYTGFPASRASSPSGVPERTNPSTGSLQPLPAHAHAPASTHFAGSRYYGGSSRPAADDSGYMSPVVPSPHTTPLMNVVAQYGGVKKRYLREMMRGGRGEEGESDEENDREVERVFSSSRGGKYDSDSGSE